MEAFLQKNLFHKAAFSVEICTAGGARGKGCVRQAEGCLKGDAFTDTHQLN